MRIDDKLIRPEYFGDHVPLKAGIATGGLVSSAMFKALCSSNQFTVVSCGAVDAIDQLLKILVAMMLLDLVTGVLAARLQGVEIQSRKMGRGMTRKVAVLMVIAGAVLMDSVFEAHGFSTGGVLYKWTTSWFIAVEGLSLYENAEKMGLPMPKFLKSAMNKLIKASERASDALVNDKTAETEAPPVPSRRIDDITNNSPEKEIANV